MWFRLARTLDSINMTGVGFATQGNTNVKAMKAAASYCSKMGKNLELQHSNESEVYGFSPRQASLVFYCLDRNDPTYTRSKQQRDPNVVVESHTAN